MRFKRAGRSSNTEMQMRDRITWNWSVGDVDFQIASLVMWLVILRYGAETAEREQFRVHSAVPTVFSANPLGRTFFVLFLGLKNTPSVCKSLIFNGDFPNRKKGGLCLACRCIHVLSALYFRASHGMGYLQGKYSVQPQSMSFQGPDSGTLICPQGCFMRYVSYALQRSPQTRQAWRLDIRIGMYRTNLLLRQLQDVRCEMRVNIVVFAIQKNVS